MPYEFIKLKVELSDFIFIVKMVTYIHSTIQAMFACYFKY